MNTEVKQHLVTSTSRSAFAFFCDDIREEASGKTTLVGVYGPKMLLNEIPATIPIVCIHLTASTPATKPFTSLTFKIYRDNEVIWEHSVNVEDVERHSVDSAEIKEKKMAFISTIRFSPYKVDSAHTLRVRVETENEELRAGALEVLTVSDFESNDVAQQLSGADRPRL